MLWGRSPARGKAGVAVRCVVDSRPRRAIASDLLDALKERQVEVLPAVKGVKAHGFERVAALSVQDANGLTTRYQCDLVAISAGFAPESQLRQQALSDGGFTLAIPQDAEEVENREAGLGLWSAGMVSGARSAPAAIRQGEICGHEAARLAERATKRGQ